MLRRSNLVIQWANSGARQYAVEHTYLKTTIDISNLAVLLLTLIVVLWQAYLIRRTLEGDTFVDIQERAERIGLSETMDFVSTFTFKDYKTYQAAVPSAKQNQIRVLVDFFNDLSHLARSRYVNDYYPIRLYSPSLLTCREKMLPWWVEGLRKARANPYLYNNFFYLCEYAKYWEDQGFKKIGYRKFLKSRGIEEL
jgi:hypothetical protein